MTPRNKVNSFKGKVFSSYVAALYLGLVVLGCSTELPEYVSVAYKELPDEIDFNIHVKPILSDKCYHCHGPDEATRKAGLQFNTEPGLYARSSLGHYAFRPGNLNKSEAIQRILSEEADYKMPPPDAHLDLDPKEKALLVKWVEQGAKWKPHWAFIRPVKSPMPEVPWPVQNNIDRLIYAQLLNKGLVPSQEAAKTTLIRRLTIDLTGLPPTHKEIGDYLNDKSENAYEKLVDRLLGSRAHAERLTLEWMDLARYSDSHGYHADGLRTMWPWRDWVIESFHMNKPYDEFVTEQLAGDLLPNATKEQILATGFNRNHPMTAEGGAIDEEFRVDYVTNRTNTFGTAFLGLTMECAKCHDHKFDPISQKEYFELFAFFNNNRELGMTFEDGNFGPLMLLSSLEEDRLIDRLSTRIDSVETLIKPFKDSYTLEKDFKNAEDFIKVKPVVEHDFETKTKVENKFYLDHRESTHIGENVSLKKGKFGKAAVFDNQYDKIDVKGLQAFELTDPFSISVWVKPSRRPVNGTTMTILGNSSVKGELYKGWDLHLDHHGNVSARLISVLPNNYLHVKSKDSIPVDEWTHLLMTYDGSSHASGLQLYINGQASDQSIEYDRLYKSIRPKRIKSIIVGKSPRGQSGDNGIYIGMIDQLAIFEVEVLSAQVAQLYNDAKEGRQLVAWTPNNKRYIALHKQLTELKLEKVELISPILEMMVMEEMQPRRKTYLLERGEYNKHGEEVERSAPGSILAFTEEYPKNRLGLSQWLFDKENPLTARVAVNRYWQMIFGHGLVRTSNDFGNQGALPTHSQLLDMMAVDFMESGWDVRKLIKAMVMTNTYRQSSRASEKLQKVDPDNKWLAKSPSYRLQAEFIRNNALVSSGLFNDTVGGESVKPYQPEGLWVAGNFSEALSKYVQDRGKKQYRKSMYTFIKRTAPPPYMTIFDMPTRDICIVKREQTNTPLQALSLLNDPQFVESSRALAVRMKQEGGDSIQAQITKGFVLALTRNPDKKEVEILIDLFLKEKEAFTAKKEDALAYLAVGDYQIPPELDVTEMAALTMVASTLLNMDEIYMKR